MGLFSSPAEDARKNNLKNLEDKRLRFLSGIQSPGEMLLTITDRGSLRALGTVDGAPCAVIAPELTGEDEYRCIPLSGCTYRKESFYEASTGLGGAFGFGTKGGVGFTIILETPQGEWEFPYIFKKSSCLICSAKKNPMLAPKRRKGDANPAWELPPIDRSDLKRIEAWLDDFLNTL